MKGERIETGLADKVALVTGATRNHGRAVALALADEGANLVLCTRRSLDLLEETAELARTAGVQAMTLMADVADPDDVRQLVEAATAEHGCIDVLVNAAGWRIRPKLLDITEDMWNEAFAVNLTGAFLTMRAVLPTMIEHGFGRIVNYSGYAQFAGSSGQGTLKNALVGLTRAVASDVGRHGITANCIGPGSISVVRTASQEIGGHHRLPDPPIPRAGTVEECAALVVFLASEHGAYITGQNYLINGGRRYS